MLVLLAGQAATAGEAYFLLVFGSQRIPNDPNYSHSYATFVRVAGEGPDPCAYVVEPHTISWFPANLKVRINALFPEPGHNFDLHTSLRHACANGERTSVWGPYVIDRDLYCRALRQIQLLESGQVRYKCFDAGRFCDRVSNCIHAVSSVTGGPRLYVPAPYHGEMASYDIVRRFEPWILCSSPAYDWIVHRLGLDAYPLIYRDRIDPACRAPQGPLRRILGPECEVQASYGPPR
jgi:hypothetical protein